MRSAATKKPDRAELRREEILDASERIFAQKGYHATGIADIANDLGIGHGTFYRYFKNKHDIALHVFDRLMLRFAEIGLSEDPESSNTLEEYRTQTSRILMRWLALGESQPHVLRFFHEQSMVVDTERLARVIDSYVDHIARFLQNGVDKGFLRAGLDVRATAEMLVALILDGTRRTLSMPDVEARKRWADAGMALMFDGVRAR
ncbi:MAG: TetR/AcrR family transcriptional regulator [Polyangiaceae bacterium]|nr:TetR/AcrR family transcriptional regulator [Polyangiaceae bacterium]